VFDQQSGNLSFTLKVLCDDGVTRIIHHSHFITIEEWRDKQLNRLGI
jgi:quinol monooxygenase YgiN